jgi:cobalt/nickel transport system permease protein
MAWVHMMIGIGEGLITALVLSAIAGTRPELLEEKETGRSYGVVAAYGMIAALGIAVFVTPLASRAPDGLESTAGKLGFAEKGGGHAAPMAEYRVPGIEAATVATSAAGLIGTVAVFPLAIVVARMVVPRKRKENGSGTE